MSQRSELAPKRRVIYAHYNDHMLQATDGKMILFPEPKTDCVDDLDVVRCYSCGVEISVRKKDIKDCDRFWCSNECYKKSPWEFPPIITSKKESEIQTEEKVCPKCGGPARGRGFAHTEDCEDVIKKTEKRTCPECGGPAKGRGFKHRDNCSLKTQPYVPVKERNAEE